MSQFADDSSKNSVFPTASISADEIVSVTVPYQIDYSVMNIVYADDGRSFMVLIPNTVQPGR